MPGGGEPCVTLHGIPGKLGKKIYILNRSICIYQVDRVSSG